MSQGAGALLKKLLLVIDHHDVNLPPDFQEQAKSEKECQIAILNSVVTIHDALQFVRTEIETSAQPKHIPRITEDDGEIDFISRLYISTPSNDFGLTSAAL